MFTQSLQKIVIMMGKHLHTKEDAGFNLQQDIIKKTQRL